MIAIQKLRQHGVPVSVMLSPVIPGLNDHEIPSIIRESSLSGAADIHMTMIRLNGITGTIFQDWLKKNFPDREKRVLNHIRSMHNGKLSESRFGVRMKGEGQLADSIHKLFKTVKSHYFKKPHLHELNVGNFRRNGMHGLFDHR